MCLCTRPLQLLSFLLVPDTLGQRMARWQWVLKAEITESSLSSNTGSWTLIAFGVSSKNLAGATTTKVFVPHLRPRYGINNTTSWAVDAIMTAIRG